MNWAAGAASPLSAEPKAERGSLASLAAAVLIAAATGLAVAAGWNNSATNDEPYFSMAAWSAVAEGAGDLCVEHPVLAWYLPGLALQSLDLEGTALPPGQRLHRLSEQIRFFLYANRAPPMAILRVARLAMLPFLTLLLAGAYCWARDLAGPAAGLWTLGFLAAQPLVLGHAFVVHTDIPAAAGWVWTGFWLHRWVRGKGSWAWVHTGLWLGFALLAKFSGIQLALLVALAVLICSLRPERRRELARLAGAALVAGAVLIGGTWPAVRNASGEDITRLAHLHGGRWQGGETGVSLVRRVATLSTPAAHWVLGLVFVVETNRHGQGANFLFGRVSTDGFPLYFPAALILKVSGPFLLAFLWAAAVAIRRRPPSFAFPLVLAAGFLISVLGASYNIGARHLMPMLPLLAVAAGCCAVRWWPAVRTAAALALIASVALAFPHFISHFSLLAGGSRHGHRFLNDSNLDWGQDWLRLAQRADREGWRPLSYVYLGPAWPRAHLADAADLLETGGLPKPGYVAVSRWAETLGPAYLDAQGLPIEARSLHRLLDLLQRRGSSTATVGNSIRVYRLEGHPQPRQQPAPRPAADSGPGNSAGGIRGHPGPHAPDPPRWSRR